MAHTDNPTAHQQVYGSKRYFECKPVSEGLPNIAGEYFFLAKGSSNIFEKLYFLPGSTEAEYLKQRASVWLRPLSLAVPESEDAFFEKSKILGEYSIDLINQSDEFNGQMLAAMEAYAQFRLLASRDEEIKRLREALEKQQQGHGIYIASKTRHAGEWLRLRRDGVPIISTWIDEALPGQTKSRTDLAERCIREATECAVLILYAEPGDVLKDANVEYGAALAAGRKVFIVGDCDTIGNTIREHRNVTNIPDMEMAIAEFKSLTTNTTPTNE